MIEANARVIALEQDHLILEAEVSSACGGCAVSKGCGTSVLAKTVGRKFTRFRVRNSIAANVGEQVVIGLPEEALIRGSLAIYLLPLLAMVLFSLGADYVLVAEAENRDLLVAFAAMLGLAAGVFLSRFYLAQEHIAAQYNPVILGPGISDPGISEKGLPVKQSDL